MNFKFMVVGIEKIKRSAFAFIFLPFNCAVILKLFHKKIKIFCAYIKRQMRVIGVRDSSDLIVL